MARRRFVEIEGLEELVEMFGKMELEAIKTLDKAVAKGSEIVVKESKKYVPKLTGALEQSIDKVKVKSKKKTRIFYNVVSKGKRKGGVRYGFAVELGTKKTKAQPFLRPATDKNETKISIAINSEIVSSLNRIN